MTERAADEEVGVDFSQFFNLMMCPLNTFFNSAGVTLACTSRGAVTDVQDSGRAEIKDDT